MAVTPFDSTSPLRIVASGMCGSQIDIAEFTVEGEAALAGHNWVAQLRKANGRKVADLEVTRSVVTVTDPDDSLHVTLRLSAAHSAALRPGVYRLQADDETAKRPWAYGTVKLLRDEAY